MAVVNSRAVVNTVDMYGVTAIRLPSTLGTNINQLIKSLFANGEQGFVYDPNDLTTMFQDAAGTIPVTDVGQPVALMLDKSKEPPVARKNILDWTQEFQLSSWLKVGVTVQADVIQAPDGTLTADKLVSNASTGTHIVYAALPTNEQYAISIYAKAAEYTQLAINNQGTKQIVYDLANGTIVSSQDGATGSITAVGDGWYRCTWFGRFTQPILRIGLALDGSGSFTGTSGNGVYIWGVQCERGEVVTSYQKVDSPYGGWIAGNHAYQTTSSMRPLLVASPQRLDFDTVDDKLITNLPAQLTGCTVIRSVPNVGTQILTNQTIPATYEDNQDHCGLIVINRALTPSETTAITTEFNKRAGV